jgi:hypothetical protein
VAGILTVTLAYFLAAAELMGAGSRSPSARKPRQGLRGDAMQTTFGRVATAIGAIFFLVFGAWALVAPSSFFISSLPGPRTTSTSSATSACSSWGSMSHLPRP